MNAMETHSVDLKLPESLEIEVTQKDIDKGFRHNCGFCPIALAVRRVLKELREKYYYYVSVTSVVTAIRAGNSSDTKRYSLPEAAKQFIMDFDAGRSVEPQKFVLPKWRL